MPNDGNRRPRGGGRVTPRVGNDDLSGVIRAALVPPGHRQKLSTQAAAAAAAAAWMDRY